MKKNKILQQNVIFCGHYGLLTRKYKSQLLSCGHVIPRLHITVGFKDAQDCYDCPQVKQEIFDSLHLSQSITTTEELNALNLKEE